MSAWEDLPHEILAHIFSFLPRRERLSCALVCYKWKEGLNTSSLWRNMVVHIDTDLMEPSTILLMRDYSRYLTTLDFGWAFPHRNNRWLPYKYKQLTKRAVRFFMILHDSGAQIKILRIFNWFDFVSFQKITYHLSRFLGIQKNLWKIVMENTNMHSANYMKILASCLGSKDKITYLDVRSCYYFQTTFDTVYFRSCVEQLGKLQTLKLDYFLLSCNLIDSILISKNTSLETLEVSVKEVAGNHIIDKKQWKKLRKACPKLRVVLIIKNVCRYEDLQVFLQSKMPLVSISIVLTKVPDRNAKCNFERTLFLLAAKYPDTLECVDLHIRNEAESIDNVLLHMKDLCPKLKTFVFNGIIENPEMVMTSYRSRPNFRDL